MAETAPTRCGECASTIEKAEDLYYDVYETTDVVKLDIMELISGDYRTAASCGVPLHKNCLLKRKKLQVQRTQAVIDKWEKE